MVTRQLLSLVRNNEAAKQSYLQDLQENPRYLVAFVDLVGIYLSEGKQKAAFDMAYHLVATQPKPLAEAWDYLADWYSKHIRDADFYPSKGRSSGQGSRCGD